MFLMFTFTICTSVPLSPCAAAVILPIPTCIDRIQPNTIDSMGTKTRNIPQAAPVIRPKVEKVMLTNEQIEQFNIIVKKCMDGSITPKEAIFQLRRGNGLTELLGIVLFVICINWYNSFFEVEGFLAARVPHLNPFGWQQGGSNQPKPGLSSSSTRTSTSTALQLSQNPTRTQISTFMKNEKEIDLKACFDEVKRRASKIDCENFKCSFKRFKSLATENGEINRQSAREAISILQVEMLGYYNETQRIDYGEGIRGPDFKVKGFGAFEHITHVEQKNPVGSAIKKNNNQTSSISREGKNIAAKLLYQKKFWSNTTKTSELKNFNSNYLLLKSPDNILGLVDNFDVPLVEKPLMERAIIKNLKNDTNIIFINSKTNI